jgi:CDP-diacylglycerol--serine O-phosphatidyltransferase
VPANALFFGGLAFSYHSFFIEHPYLLIAIALVFSILLVSEIPMFSLKFKNIKWKDNLTQYIFLIGAAVLIAIFHLGSFCFIILWYILLSLIVNFLKKQKKCQSA